MIRVVIVEDELILRKGLVLSVNWEALGAVIVGEGDNGRRGLEIILKEKPDVVITDVKMPVMDGLEMLRLARAQYGFHSIVLTGFSEFDYARQAITLGVDDYLLKPVDEAELSARMTHLADVIRQERRNETILKQVRQKPGGGHAGLAVEQTDTGVNNYYAARALTEIKERYHQKLSLDMLARQLGVSASYLSQKFKEETNCTFLDFLNQYRLRKAVQLLSTGKYRIAEVSEQVGFTNYKHFHAVFKKYTDLTPSEFLKNQSCIIAGNIQMDRFFPEETEKRSEAE